MTSRERDAEEVRGWALQEIRKALTHDWVLRERDDLFCSWTAEDHQRLLAVAVLRERGGIAVRVTPAVVLTAVERARLDLRRASGLRGTIEDEVRHTLHADACPALGRMTVFVEGAAPAPTCADVVRRASAWCNEFAGVTRVREVLEDEGQLRAWCGRAREPRDLETLAAILAAAGDAAGAAALLG